MTKSGYTQTGNEMFYMKIIYIILCAFNYYIPLRCDRQHKESEDAQKETRNTNKYKKIHIHTLSASSALACKALSVFVYNESEVKAKESPFAVNRMRDQLQKGNNRDRCMQELSLRARESKIQVHSKSMLV